MEYQSKLKLLLKSRKFWAATIGIFLLLGKSYLPGFPLSDVEMQRVIYLLIAYILGTAVEDAFSIRVGASRAEKKSGV